ncbi:MAG: hypothetical protein A2W52_01455 [Candidatus Taylorbacteria bacterium RIFCSPHIGHO2_02_49_25]|uniref:LTD domain-containing protein n=1 Tax=Candidatus Taylorbacteria bacterium RIFCSPHIGHO2_02_49_25 TaxID=1802305 RepID=A0A1G2MDD3_9BACT|nr:MAG: hypothetical protein A2759_03380 [Candidatus Taylorbacteria bacterium RIFCSPHIGHO2_01_FULL_49_60]OHA21926.1 MAG: hypothetical protein A2W52_01455 [Candidatus Taylorbacteria bacterium RIFCSPHIGHO2_02_49_25]OHA35286.1 MAG: hypothetical protein A2W65_04585 [Candidatus Taylorbacteria bacterium RIFCSPLOWO2_02_50_13]OHA36553.1 MAG: hypothetical protein A3B27_02005 [Candidatus Taylorbacteria bacterium RIFCSPLOWO2_01_FULL_50_130]OHA41970.1 MAG: hypothetical protein A3H73_00050 [Candidatus Taylo
MKETRRKLNIDGIVRLPKTARARVVDLRFRAPLQLVRTVSKNTTRPARFLRMDTHGAIFSFGKIFSKISGLTALTLIILLAGLPAVSAFEAHIVNVTATFIQIDPPVLTPPGGPPAYTWDNTNGGTNLTGTVNVVMTDADTDATHIFYNSGAGTNPATVSDPVCGQPVVPGVGGGGEIPIEIIQLSLTSDTVIKAIGCDGNTGAAHRSVTNTKVYDFADLDDPVADQYSPIADSFVEEDVAAGNNGTDNKLQIKSRDSSGNNRTFIRFDFHFPGGTIVNSSLLKLFMNNAPSSSRTYEARKVNGTWTETGITWNNQPATSTTVTATTTTGTDDDTPLSWNVKTDVVDFVSGASANNGWALNDSSENSGNEEKAEFISRDKSGADEPKRPYLEVNFTAPVATTAYLVINEVYPFVGDGKGSDSNNEWVEIYNPTAASVDISGWQICDNTLCDFIPASTPAVPPHGFALIANETTTWSSFWPGTPAGAVKIGLGSAIGGGLANAGDGDKVELRNPDAALVDAMSYGPNTAYITLPAPKVGISFARIVKGYDTDTATDWVLNNTPNPGTNPSVNGAEVMRFTSDGVEVAATEADLPPIMDSPSEKPAPEDLSSPEQAVNQSAPDILASGPSGSLGVDEIIPDTATSSGGGTTSTDSSDAPPADAAGAPATEADSSESDSPAVDEVSSNNPAVPTDSTVGSDDSVSAPPDNLNNSDTSDSTGSTDSSQTPPEESDSSTPSDSNQEQAILPEPDDSSQITQSADIVPVGDVPPPPPSDSDSSESAAEPPADVPASE